MLLGNLEGVDVERNSLTDTSEWHLSFGESDAFMLNI